ncbi:MAG: hypothetical protein ACOX69_01515 [Coriobacteriales bacterium]
MATADTNMNRNIVRFRKLALTSNSRCMLDSAGAYMSMARITSTLMRRMHARNERGPKCACSMANFIEISYLPLIKQSN